MLIDPKNSWNYAFNPLKVVGLIGKRDYSTLLLEGGHSICVENMSFNDLLEMINKAQTDNNPTQTPTRK